MKLNDLAHLVRVISAEDIPEPCPLCGSQEVSLFDDGQFSICCDACDLTTPQAYPTEPAAVSGWNLYASKLKSGLVPLPPGWRLPDETDEGA